MTVLPELYLPVQKIEREPILKSANRTHRQTERVPTFCAHDNSETSDNITISGLSSTITSISFSMGDEYTASIIRYNQQLKEKKNAQNRSSRKIFSLKKFRVFNNGHGGASLFSSPTNSSTSSPLTPSSSLSPMQISSSSTKSQSHQDQIQVQQVEKLQSHSQLQEIGESKPRRSKSVSNNSQRPEVLISSKFTVNDASSITSSLPLFSDPLTRTLSDGLSGTTLTDKKLAESHTKSASVSWSNNSGDTDDIARLSPQSKTFSINNNSNYNCYNHVHNNNILERNVKSYKAKRFLGLSCVKHKRPGSAFDSHSEATLHNLDDVSDSDDDLFSICDDGFVATNFIRV